MAKLIIFAEGDVGLKCVKWIAKNFIDDIGLIISSSKDIQDISSESGIRFLEYQTDDDVIEKVGGGKEVFDLGFLIWWPKIIKKPIIDLAKGGFINTHPSFLPYNRGKHYSFWALIEGCPFGVTLHRVDLGIDTGEIVAQLQIETDWTDSGETLFRKAKLAMYELFTSTFPDLRTGNFSSFPQRGGDGSFHKASEIVAASEIDLDQKYTARDLLNLLRAKTFTGQTGCRFQDSGKWYEVSVSIKELK